MNAIPSAGGGSSRPTAAGFSTREVARLVDLPMHRIRALARAGVLAPTQGVRGELRFSFQDLSLLRAARALLRAEIPLRRVTRALKKLRQQVPPSQALSSVQLAALRDDIVARDGETSWEPESGQVRLRFDSTIGPRLVGMSNSAVFTGQRQADNWCERGSALEPEHPDEAADAYRQALAIDPLHPEANLSLGLLLHERNDVIGAERHYRAALKRGRNVLATFNLAVALDDQQRRQEALATYKTVLELDAKNADAHYNLARLYELLGKTDAAIRHLKEYRRLASQV